MGVMAHAINPSTRQTEASRSLWFQSKPGMQWIPGHIKVTQKNPVSKYTKIEVEEIE